MADTSLLGMLATKMKYDTERQKVLSENIANANTPNYMRKDINQPDFASMVQSSMVTLETTHANHIKGLNSSQENPVVETKDTVQLDMEAVELAKNNTDFTTASATYKKIMALISDALGNSSNS